MEKLKNPIFVIGLLSAGFLLSSCNQSLNSIAPNSPPQALPSAAAEPVNSGQLPPINSGQQPPVDQPVASAPSTPENQPLAPVDSAAIDATSSNVKISREGMAGSWQVPTDSADCRIILAFTKWSGGYRAATRRCNSPEIQTINAWDVKDQSVVLVDQSGNEVARLFGTNSGRYDGRTKNGDPVSFTR